jgi:myo-inositol-1(or 4)-monophosphatase
LPAADDLRERHDLRDLLARAVREGGELALKTFQSQVKHWIKGESSPVSEVDLAVDQLLRQRLCPAGSVFGWMSEETEDDPARLDADRLWVVDPIDGTRAYLAGFPDWAVSAALVERGRPVLAALYAPVTGEFFWAAVGEGAQLNGAPISVDQGEAFEGARVAGPKRRLDLLAESAPGFETVGRIHSLALRLARVAAGTLDVALTGPESHDWDLAAADLLVHEAGGAITTLGGAVPVYNRPEPVHAALMAAGPGRHNRLLALVRDWPAEFA